MRHLIAAVAASVFVAGTPVTLAQDDKPLAVGKDQAVKDKKSPAMKASKGTASSFTADDRGEKPVADAMALLVRVREAYRKAPALAETITIEVKSPMGDQKTVIATRYMGADFQIGIEGQMEMIGLGGNLLMYMPSAPERYLETPFLDGNAEATILSMTQGGGLPDPAIPFRLGKKDVKPEDLPRMLGLGAMPNPTVVGFRSEGDFSRILMEGAGGSNVITVNASTGLIDRMDLQVSPPGAPPEFKLDVAFTIDAKVMKALPEKIAFDAAGKTKVEAMDQLGPQPLAVGEMAPDFTLETFGGESVSLADLRGEVVVIDFWATWCGPCKRGLPVLNEVAKWAKEEGLPVKFFGVNSWEQGDPAARRASATGYWDAQNFVFPSLFDSDDAVVGKFGVTGIPTSFVIGPDGRIFKIHQGFGPGMAETMKKELTEAVSAKG